MILLDAVCVLVGFFAANAIRFDDLFESRGLSYSAAILPPYLALALGGGAYSLEALEHPIAGTFKSLRALTITVLTLLLALFLSKSSAGVSRATVGVGVVLAAAAIFIFRRAYAKYADTLTSGRFVNELLLVDHLPVETGGPRQAFFAHEQGITPWSNDPATAERLGRLLEGFDRVVVAATKENRVAWREMLKGSGVDIEILAPELDQLGAIKVRRSDLGSAVLVAAGPLSVQQRIVKRAFDLVASIALLLLLAPLMLGIALAIRFTSSGPALFRQSRFGRANRQFEMLKFRTMYITRCDANATRLVSRFDDRVTPLGRILRRTSLDELPQLINVISGEMSLVGPRPHALAATAADALYWNIDSRYWHRGAVKPGITGLAQVRGYRGETTTTNDVTNRVDSDLEYLSRWSVWEDMRILIGTARVLVHQNAF